MIFVKFLMCPAKVCNFFIKRSRFLYKLIGEKRSVEILYKAVTGKKLNLDNPLTFNEKLQWLKVNNHNPLFSTMVDKYAVKQFVVEKIGEEYVVPTIGVWKSFDDINFDALPQQFVLKCTHDSGGLIICKDKNLLDLAEAKKKIGRCLKRNFYYSWYEFPYKNVKPRIIAEQYLAGADGDVVDYKVHCFNGKARFVLTCSERFSETGLKEDFYDLSWNRMPVARPDHPNSEKGTPKPKTFAKMIDFAESFAKGIPFLRVDFYEVDAKLYFGEFTFFPASGLNAFVPKSWDETFGSWLNISV